MNVLLIIVPLQVLAIVVILAEFILPSAGILSVTAAGLIGYSVYVAYTQVGAMGGTVLVVADIIAVPLAVVAGLKLLANSPVTLRKTLARELGGQAQAAELATYVNKSGIAVSDLRPSGIARIEGRRLDVITHGDYIEKGATVTVISVEGNQVIVAAAGPHSQSA
jgi:membrane-bound serine protease (ClpP class)